ncbi:MAG: hypothetical protein RLN62_06940 [Rickettsiales bacterium]
MSFKVELGEALDLDNLNTFLESNSENLEALINDQEDDFEVMHLYFGLLEKDAKKPENIEVLLENTQTSIADNQKLEVLNAAFLDSDGQNKTIINALITSLANSEEEISSALAGDIIRDAVYYGFDIDGLLANEKFVAAARQNTQAILAAKTYPIMRYIERLNSEAPEEYVDRVVNLFETGKIESNTLKSLDEKFDSKDEELFKLSNDTLANKILEELKLAYQNKPEYEFVLGDVSEEDFDSTAGDATTEESVQEAEDILISEEEIEEELEVEEKTSTDKTSEEEVESQESTEEASIDKTDNSEHLSKLLNSETTYDYVSPKILQKIINDNLDALSQGKTNNLKDNFNGHFGALVSTFKYAEFEEAEIPAYEQKKEFLDKSLLALTAFVELIKPEEISESGPFQIPARSSSDTSTKYCLIIDPSEAGKQHSETADSKFYSWLTESVAVFNEGACDKRFKASDFDDEKTQNFARELIKTSAESCNAHNFYEEDEEDEEIQINLCGTQKLPELELDI